MNWKKVPNDLRAEDFTRIDSPPNRWQCGNYCIIFGPADVLFHTYGETFPSFAEAVEYINQQRNE